MHFDIYFWPTEQPIKAQFFVKSPLNRSIRGACPGMATEQSHAIFSLGRGALGFSGGARPTLPPPGYGPGYLGMSRLPQKYK